MKKYTKKKYNRNTKKHTNKRHTNKRYTNKRQTNKRYTNKRYTNKRYNLIKRKQYGGNFNEKQINIIRNAIISHREQEPFTDLEIEEYIQKLNDISQFQLQGQENSFDSFYENMIQHLEGDADITFKEWIDRVYDKQVNNVETDIEVESDEEDMFN